MTERTALENKRLMRLKPGQIISVISGESIIKAKVIHNFKNAKIIDLKLKHNRWEPYFMITGQAKPYQWSGFDITLKEDLI